MTPFGRKLDMKFCSEFGGLSDFGRLDAIPVSL